MSRLVRPERDDLSPEAAESLLRMRLNHSDLGPLRELVTKNRDDALSPAERGELESYLRISPFVDLMHVQALRSLKSLLRGRYGVARLTQS